MARAPLPLLALALVGCNSYDLFRLSGYQQESFSNKADILFLIDNTDTMRDEASALAVNFAQFIGNIQTQEDALVREDLGDAVTNYTSYVQDRGAFVDFQIAVTTTDIDNDWGALQGRADQQILTRETPDLAEKFTENLLCDSTCFNENTVIGSDPGYNCGDPIGDEVTVEYLDCVCGAGQWEGANCSDSGVEEGLEAVFMALCRSVPNPPEDCFADTPPQFEDPEMVAALFTQDDVLSNDGLLRPDATFIPVIVSDEGDSSRREPTADAFPDHYVELFEMFQPRMSWVVIGPPLDAAFEVPVGCTGTQDWNVFRYDFMVRASAGLKLNIAEPSGGACPPTNFADNLNQFGALLQNLLTVFELQSVPDPDSILVFVDGEQIPEAAIQNTDAFGFPVYSAGWSYESEINAIQFHGEAVPANDALVQVYYDPVDGMPRELPF